MALSQDVVPSVWSIFDPCVYVKKVNNAVFSLIILVLYVDDMLILAKQQSNVNKCKSQLKSAFKMKNLGPAKRIFSMDVHMDLQKG